MRCMEGRVYNCTWAKAGNRFKVWLAADPKLCAEADGFSEADEQLWSALCNRFGDGENVREYEPPAPTRTSDDVYLADGLVTLVGNSRAERIGPIDPLFANGLCKECGAGQGERTDALLEVGSIESGFDSIFIIRSGFDFYLYSEDFLSLLQPDESARFVWRPVRRNKGARKAFFECVGINSVPFVTIRNQAVSGWECGECGHRVYSVSRKDFCFSKAVSSSSLKQPIPSCFPAGPEYGAQACVTRDRWLQIRGRRGARGIVPGPLGVVRPSEADSSPSLPKRFLSKEGYRVSKN